MNFFSPGRHCKKTAALLVFALTAGAIFLLSACKPRTPLHPNVSTPLIAIESLDSRSLYFTASARALLAEKKPGLIVAGEQRDFLQAQWDPTLWRQLDHRYHFDTVLLCGDPGEFRPLLQHLIGTRDWTLTYLDHTSLIFRRPPAKPWSLDDFRALERKFANYSKPDRVVFLTQTAAKLLAIGQPAPARQQLEEALRLDRKSPETWTQLALYEVQRGKWQEALGNADRALEIDKNNARALATKAWIYYSTKQFNEALPLTERLVQAAPDDSNALFFHAKIAHGAHAYGEEIATLKHLIEIAERGHWARAGYRIYLGQSYARDGQAAAALEEFEKARAEGGLDSKLRSDLDALIQQIKNRTAL